MDGGDKGVRRDITIPNVYWGRVINIEGVYYIQDEEREYLYYNVADFASPILPALITK